MPIKDPALAVASDVYTALYLGACLGWFPSADSQADGGRSAFQSYWGVYNRAATPLTDAQKKLHSIWGK
jgi:hypothetical protein